MITIRGQPVSWLSRDDILMTKATKTMVNWDNTNKNPYLKTALYQ